MTSSFSDQKKQFRQDLRNRLAQRHFDFIHQAAQALQVNLDQCIRSEIAPFLSYFPHQSRVATGVAFVPSDHEPSIEFEAAFDRLGLRSAYVRIESWDDPRELSARFARRDLAGQWEEYFVPSQRGLERSLMQPRARQARCLDDEIALIFVPALAYSLNFVRLGQGGGFYDRFLSSSPHALRVGLALSDMLIPELPEESHDQRVDIILTESSAFFAPWFLEAKKNGILKR